MTPIKKALSIACAATMSLSCLVFAAGCSCSSDAPSDEFTAEEINAQPIEILESGYTVVNESTINYAFVIMNPNDEYVANNVTFTIEGKDGEGQTVFTNTDELMRVYPGVQTALTGTGIFMREGEIVDFEITPSNDQEMWQKSPLTPEQYNSMYSISNVQNSPQLDGSVVLDGTLTVHVNNNEEWELAQQGANITAVLYDAEGNIVAGGFRFGITLTDSTTNSSMFENEDSASDDSVSGSLSAPFNISISDAPEYASYELYATPGFISLA